MTLLMILTEAEMKTIMFIHGQYNDFYTRREATSCEKKDVSWCLEKRKLTVNNYWNTVIFSNESQIVLGEFTFGEHQMKHTFPNACAHLDREGYPLWRGVALHITELEHFALSMVIIMQKNYFNLGKPFVACQCPSY